MMKPTGNTPLNIGVFQNWGMGDIIMTIPVLAELRRTHPEAKIHLIVRGKAQASLLRGSPLVDEIIETPGRTKKLALLPFFFSLRRFSFNMVYIGTRVSAVAAVLLRFVAGIRTLVGDGTRFRALYAFHNPIEGDLHRVDRMLKTLSLWTGETPAPPVFDLPISPEGRMVGTKILASERLEEGNFVAIHPGGSAIGGHDKRLTPGLVSQTIRALQAENKDMRAVILFGPEDQDILVQFTPPPSGAINVTGASLETTKYILSKAKFFIGSDSGLGHIASAFRVPTVTVAGPTNPVETRPYGKNSRVIRSLEEFTCRPCWFTELRGHCPYSARCMTTITADQIVDASRSNSISENLVSLKH